MSEAKEHEEYVRSRWEWFASFDLSDEEDREDNDPEWLVQVCDASAGNPVEFYGATEDDAWSAAYAFTKEREEQMRQVEREIEWLKGKQAGQKYHTQQAINQGNSETAAKADERYCTITRILAREQAALAELKKGMRQ